ncbi:MAG: anaerobic ribonucleoside-triphosphate reductase activating protein [Oligoflexia bacterium]|nr:anaerobic ribonucleoside-triphosphate reductase activating protein [Oligoflexia bacterium]
MQIAGIEKNSFVDYPGKIAAVIFTYGCNLNCGYCHNRSLLLSSERFQTEIDDKKIFDFLKDRKKFIEGVVISGGEPTIWPDLLEFILQIKRIGYPIKLDTNGTNPKLLQQLIDNKIIDYVAMDVKAPLEKYSAICNSNVNLNDLERSIEILLSGKIDYEFRTTLIPELTKEDLFLIAKEIKYCKKYVLQIYRSDNRNKYNEHDINIYQFTKVLSEEITIHEARESITRK